MFTCRGGRRRFVYKLKCRVSILIARESLVINRLGRSGRELPCYEKIEGVLRWHLPYLVRLREVLDLDDTRDPRLKRTSLAGLSRQLSIINATIENVHQMCVFISEKELEIFPACITSLCDVCTGKIQFDLPPLA